MNDLFEAAFHEIMKREGGPEGVAAARTQWRQCALEGDDQCAFNLGLANAGGHGAPTDYQEARRWFSYAETLGNEEAGEALVKVNAAMRQHEGLALA